MIRSHVVKAIFRRNFVSYFSNPTGYVFIAVFVVLSAAMAFWPDTFFANNLANLDTLNQYFPYLLLFFVPAVAMGAWSEERKQGTDELLLTLPARDVEVVLGKYLAGLGIYSVSLLFSLTHVIVLAFLGSPDLGVMAGTYLGYWFLGAGLLAVAMAASLLTSSMTVAFILGAVFCAIPVFLGDSGSVVGGGFKDGLEALGVDAAFYDFAKGVASLKAILYFAAIAVVFLYVNLLLLARRHADRSEQWVHFGARLASLAVIGLTLSLLATRAGCRADLTSERLYSLSDATTQILDRIDPTRPVLVTAFVSREVPSDWVEQRENLVGLLREYDARGGRKVEVRVVDTEKYSAEAREAEGYGIRAEGVRQVVEGEHGMDEIYLGASFRCGAEEIVIPVVQRGMSVEYELTRAIGTVSGAKRRKVGIATTDAKVFGGMDFQTFRPSPEWQIVTELKRQYEVAQVGLDEAVKDAYDVLLVPQPSSLTQPQMDNLLAYVKQGHGVLLFDDPFPEFNPSLGPGEPKNGGQQRNPFQPPPPSEPKGDIRKFYEEIGVVWNPELIAWETWNPHPMFRDLPREYAFVGPGSGNPSAFNPDDPITSGLQEMIIFWGGVVEPKAGSPLAFTPLVQSSPRSGTILEGERFQRGFFGAKQPVQFPRYRNMRGPVTIAARLTGTLPAPPPPKDAPGDAPPPPGPSTINAVVCADLDTISERLFYIRAAAPEGLVFDNITFVLNAVDVLAKDESYVALRKRRPKHRTLSKFESLTKSYKETLHTQTTKAEEEAKAELDKAQKRLDDAVAEIRKRTDLDQQTIEIQTEAVRQAEQRRFEASQKEIEDSKKRRLEEAKSDYHRSVKAVKGTIKALAVLLPPVPALLIALFVFGRRVTAGRRPA